MQVSLAIKLIFDSKIFDNRSFLNIRIEDKVLLTSFIDKHFIIDYPKGLVFTCATPGENSKEATVKKLKKRKKGER